MIKINLLPARKPKRQAEPGMRPLIIGVGAIVGVAAVVALVVDLPRRSELSTLNGLNDDLQDQINAKNKQLQGYPELQAAADQASKRAGAINRLVAAKVVPANVLHELGEILTPNHLPTQSLDMGRKTGPGNDSDPNKRFQGDWDPSHVWLTSFVDTAGTFKMEGGAQAESDVIQFSKRLQASVYFMEVAPAGGERVADKDSGLNYYKFTITGKVAY